MEPVRPSVNRRIPGLPYHRASASSVVRAFREATIGKVVLAGNLAADDAAAVLVVPVPDLAGVGMRPDAIAAKETLRRAELDEGRPIPSWVDAVFAEKGCEMAP